MKIHVVQNVGYCIKKIARKFDNIDDDYKLKVIKYLSRKY